MNTPEHTPLTEAEREPESLRLFREAHEAAVAQGYIEGDVNHYVQPIIGMLRLAAHQGESIPPDQAERFAGALTKGCNAETALLAYLKDAAHTSTSTAEPCPGCGHPTHGDTDCGEVVGYDHLNGDHECGCPGPEALGDLVDAATADTGLRERVEAELDYAEDHGARDEDDEAWVEVAVIRAALDATAAPTTDTGARDE